ERHVRLALAGQHPDLRTVEPEGNTFRKSDAERVVRAATLAPIEGRRKVVVADGCQDMEDEAAGYLLKTVEEPPASTVFVLLATELVPELVTIASRCVRIELAPLPTELVAERLVAEGVDPDRAATAAAAAGGDLDRARTLATDERLALRHAAWREVPYRLDGTGHTAATVVAELQSMIGEALGPLQQRQAAELAALEEQIEQYGLRGSGRRATSPRCAGSARPSCASGWRPWPPPTGTPWRPTAPGPTGSTRCAASRTPPWRCSATRTRRCCSRRWSPTWRRCRGPDGGRGAPAELRGHRRRAAIVTRPARVAQLAEQRTRNA